MWWPLEQPEHQHWTMLKSSSVIQYDFSIMKGFKIIKRNIGAINESEFIVWCGRKKDPHNISRMVLRLWLICVCILCCTYWEHDLVNMNNQPSTHSVYVHTSLYYIHPWEHAHTHTHSVMISLHVYFISLCPYYTCVSHSFSLPHIHTVVYTTLPLFFHSFPHRLMLIRKHTKCKRFIV